MKQNQMISNAIWALTSGGTFQLSSMLVPPPPPLPRLLRFSSMFNGEYVGIRSETEACELVGVGGREPSANIQQQQQVYTRIGPRV